MENKKLQNLNIGGNNKIGDDGVSHITEGLRQNNIILIELMLHDCGMLAKGNCSYNYYK